MNIVKQIRTQIDDNNALISKADIGNTLVMMKRDEYTIE